MGNTMAVQSGAWKFRTFMVRPHLLLRIFRDRRTPWIAKLLPLLAIIYFVSPFDLIPDFIPFFGQLDDITIVLYLFSLALDHVPDAVYQSAGIVFPTMIAG